MSSSDANKKPRPGPWPPAEDSAAMPPSSWAKRTGFRPKFSGETNASDSGQITTLPPPRPPAQAQPNLRPHDTNLDLEAGRPRPSPTPNGDPAVARDVEKEKEQTPPVRKRRDSDGGKNPGPNAQSVAGEGSRKAAAAAARIEEATTNVLPQTVLDDDGFLATHSHMKYELRDSPGLGELFIFVNYF